jgi:hypothetical protein
VPFRRGIFSGGAALDKPLCGGSPAVDPRHHADAEACNIGLIHVGDKLRRLEALATNGSSLIAET